MIRVLAPFTLANTADALLMALAASLGLREGNPLMGGLMQAFGPAGGAMLKISLGAGLALLLYRLHYQMALRIGAWGFSALAAFSGIILLLELVK